MQQSFVLRYSKLWQRKVINMELTFLILEGTKPRQQYEITFTIHEVNKMENYIMCDVKSLARELNKLRILIKFLFM